MSEPSAKSKTPAIRFKGFGGEWVEKAFNEIFDNRSNNTLSRAELNYQLGLAKNIHYGDVLIKFGEVLDLKTARVPFITSNEIVNTLVKNKLQDGDIIFADAAEDETVGKCTEVTNIGEYFVFSGLHTIAVSPKLPFAPMYLGYYLNSSAFHDQLLSLMQGTKVLSISKTAIQNTLVVYPSKNKEQTQIGNFFQQLDSLIAQHQQKHDKLRCVKKALLTKMFPKQGETQPAIRFKGFSEAWEEKALGDICSVITKGTTPLDKSGNGEINFIKVENIDPFSGQIISTSKIKKEEHENYLRRSQLSSGDILFSIAGTLGRIAIVDRNNLPANTNQALAIIRLKRENIGYVTTFLKGKAVDDYVKKNPTVGAQPNLSLEQVGNINIVLPDNKEQTKIGNLFQQLDTLISQQQSQLTKLNNIKQSMLAKMFV